MARDNNVRSPEAVTTPVGLDTTTSKTTDPKANKNNPQLDRLVGLSMLVIASSVFLYYTIWTLLLPFVAEDQPIRAFFPPQVWAIRIPVILLLMGGAVVGSFLSLVMIRSNRKKAAKAQQQQQQQKMKAK